MQFPHCDPRVLHARGECEFCDMHPEWQKLRLAWKINFTGGRNMEFSVCPAEIDRSLGDVNCWPGNRPAQL